MSARILIVDDDPLVPRTLRILLRKHGHDVDAAGDAEEALARVRADRYDVVISDINMPGADGFEVLGRVKDASPDTEVILITGYGTIENAVRGMKEGAFDYVTKPVLDDEMVVVIERAIESVRLRTENADLRAQLANARGGSRNAIGKDPSFVKLFETVDAVAPTRATVLVTGESGTGKSLLARAIHDASPRRDEPFVEINCGALPEGLLESELFGHAKGAFTGATSARTGRFQAANGGTLFLDEIGTASPALQVKLLRVIQERRFEPVGSEETIEVDVRLILATNDDLEEKVETGEFRRDLYYRISVVPMLIPPLRDRMGDIPLLASHFVGRYADENDKPVQHIDDNAMTILQAHNWPGNIRELENVIERGVILCRTDTLTPRDLPPEMTRSVSAPEPGQTLPLRKALEIPEREIIERTLRSHNWNRQETAAALMINRTTLFNKMRKYGLLGKQKGGPANGR
ncbi:MAG: sigma-54 dependent transcriptional regulator [Planctomycetota bacterium]|nr:sigma-54 dependent transcriptional regulator [Planctomycetota bacterium]